MNRCQNLAKNNNVLGLKAEQKAYSTLKRPGCRLKNMELAQNWAEWVANCKREQKEVWSQLCARLEKENIQLQ